MDHRTGRGSRRALHAKERFSATGRHETITEQIRRQRAPWRQFMRACPGRCPIIERVKSYSAAKKPMRVEKGGRQSPL